MAFLVAGAHGCPRAYSDLERETEALRACVVSGREPGVLLSGGGAIPIMQRMWALAYWVRMCGESLVPGCVSFPGSFFLPLLLSVITQRRGRRGVWSRRL